MKLQGTPEKTSAKMFRIITLLLAFVALLLFWGGAGWLKYSKAEEQPQKVLVILPATGEELKITLGKVSRVQLQRAVMFVVDNAYRYHYNTVYIHYEKLLRMFPLSARSKVREQYMESAKQISSSGEFIDAHIEELVINRNSKENIWHATVGIAGVEGSVKSGTAIGFEKTINITLTLLGEGLKVTEITEVAEGTKR